MAINYSSSYFTISGINGGVAEVRGYVRYDISNTATTTTITLHTIGAAVKIPSGATVEASVKLVKANCTGTVAFGGTTYSRAAGSSPTLNATSTTDYTLQRFGDLIDKTYVMGRGASISAYTFNTSVKVSVKGFNDQITTQTFSISTTVYAPARDSYTINFYPNGGSGGTGTITKYYGYDITIPQGPTRTGYTFRGWGTSSTTTTASYQPGQVYQTNAGANFYALWSKTLTLSYNANSGSGAPSSESKTIWNNATIATFSVSTVVPTRTGYRFAGWGIASASGTTAGSSISINVNTTLYAKWAINQTTFTTAVNSSALGSATGGGTYSYGNTITLTAIPDSNKGAYFTNWTFYRNDTSSSAGGSTNNPWQVTYSTAGTNYAHGSSYTATANFNNTYTVTLNSNGGSGGTNSVTATYGSGMPAITIPTRTGYTFTGYWTATSGGTQYYSSGGGSARNWDKTSATTLYARWSKNSYTYTVDGSSHTAYYDTQFTVNNPTRTGFIFDGWDITGMDTACIHYYGNNSTTNTSLFRIKETSFKNLRATSGTVVFASQWTPIYKPPTFEIKLAKRATYDNNTNTYKDEEGECAKIEYDYTPLTIGNTPKTYTLQLEYRINGTSQFISIGNPIITETEKPSEIEPIYVGHIQNNDIFNIDTVYYFRLKATLNNEDVDTTTEPRINSPLYSGENFISTAHYTIDINKAGDTIGFFRVAPDGAEENEGTIITPADSDYISNTVYVGGGIQFLNSDNDYVPVSSVMIKRW